MGRGLPFLQRSLFYGHPVCWHLTMLPGRPFAVIKSGARNAGILAAQILALSDEVLAGKLVRFREEMERKSRKKDAQLQLHCYDA